MKPQDVLTKLFSVLKSDHDKTNSIRAIGDELLIINKNKSELFETQDTILSELIVLMVVERLTTDELEIFMESTKGIIMEIAKVRDEIIKR